MRVRRVDHAGELAFPDELRHCAAVQPPRPDAHQRVRLHHFLAVVRRHAHGTRHTLSEQLFRGDPAFRRSAKDHDRPAHVLPALFFPELILPALVRSTLAGIASGSHYFVTDALCRAVADENSGKHIRLHVPEFAERTDLRLLSGPADIAHRAADLFGRTGFKQDVARFLEIIRPLFAGDVVEHYGKIPLRRHSQPLLDRLPRRHQVAQADQGKIVNERSTQPRRTTESSRHTGDHADLHGGEILRHLIDQPGQSVNTCVSAADKSDSLPLCSFFKGERAPLLLLTHRRCDDLLFGKSGEAVKEQVHIYFVAGDNRALLDRVIGLHGHLIERAGANADHCENSFF